MGTTLTGTTPQDTYDSLIKVTDNGPLSGTAKYLSDGLGNDSTLALSTARVGIGTTSPSFPLHVLGSAGTIARITDGTSHIDLYSGSGLSEISAATTMLLSTSGTEKVRITSAGNVGIGTSSPAATLEVKGGTSGFRSITSDATSATFSMLTDLGLGYDNAAQLIAGQSSSNNAHLILATKTSGSITEKVRILASGGITFNGDTAAANALDDYEEGTWTPAIAFGGASVGLTYVRNSGTYTKVGRKVTVCGDLILSAKGSSTGSVTITGLPFTIGSATNFLPVPSFRFADMAFSGFVQGYGGPATTVINMENVTSGAGSTPLTHADFEDATQLMVTLTYFV
jgi:hypothetical protein